MDTLRQWPITAKATRAEAFTCRVCGDRSHNVGSDGWFFNADFRATNDVQAYCQFCARALQAADKVALIYRR